MAKGIYVGVGGVTKKVKAIYIGVNGAVKKVKKVFIGVAGAIKLVFSTEITKFDTGGVWGISHIETAGASNPNYAIFVGGREGSTNKANGYAFNSSFVRSTPPDLSVARYGLAGASVGNYAIFNGGRVGNSGKTTVDTYNSSLVRGSISGNYDRWNKVSASSGLHAFFLGGTNSSNTIPYGDAYNASLVRSMIQANVNISGPNRGSKISHGNVIFTDWTTMTAFNGSLVRSTPIVKKNEYQQGLIAAGVGSNNTHAICAGGRDTGMRATTEVWAYDSSFILIQNLPPLLVARRNGMATTTLDDNCIFLGGMDSSGSAAYSIKDVYVYDSSLIRSMLPNISAGSSEYVGASVGNYAIFTGYYGSYLTAYTL